MSWENVVTITIGFVISVALTCAVKGCEYDYLKSKVGIENGLTRFSSTTTY